MIRLETIVIANANIRMKLLEIIFSDMNFEIMYRVFVSDVTIIKFVWSEIP